MISSGGVVREVDDGSQWRAERVNVGRNNKIITKLFNTFYTTL